MEIHHSDNHCDFDRIADEPRRSQLLRLAELKIAKIIEFKSATDKWHENKSGRFTSPALYDINNLIKTDFDVAKLMKDFDTCKYFLKKLPYSVLLASEFGEGDVVAHGEEAHEADEEEREEGGEAGMGSGDHEEPIEESAGNAGHRIDLFLEDEGFLVEEDVADDAACRSRDASHDDGDPDGMSAIEGFLESGDGEEGESEGVEDEPRVVEALEGTGEDDDEDLREGGADEVER